MKNKDQFKKPKARHTGDDLYAQSKNLLGNIVDSHNDKLAEVPKTHSFTILPSYIEKMRDLVHFKKLNGNPYYTQGILMQEALDQFFNTIEEEIPKRPKEVILKEKRRTGRRSKSNQKNSLSQNINLSTSFPFS